MKPIICVVTFALGTSSPIVTPARAADATSGGEVPTAEDQSNAAEDVKVTQAIRRALVKDAGLSTAAKNVKVITARQNVTLRGSVRSAEEKARILEVARQNAGGAAVDDRLKISAKP
jgi:hyperosmotically inducible periplasmic protein